MSRRIIPTFLSAALGLTILCAPAAHAHVIATDGDSSFPTTGCTIGAACTGITLPFSIITPALTTNTIYVYTSGIVSLGSQLPLTATYGDVASLGHDFLAPGFVDFGAAPPTTYTTVAKEDYNGTAGAFRVTWAIDGGAIFQLQLLDLSVFPDPTDDLAPFLHDPTKIGDVEADFAYGSPLDSWNGLTVDEDPGLPSGAIVGYGVGALNFSLKLGSDLTTLSTTNYGVDLTGARVIGTTPGLPEPSSWTLLILGFGALGAVLRRRRLVGALI